MAQSPLGKNHDERGYLNSWLQFAFLLAIQAEQQIAPSGTPMVLPVQQETPQLPKSVPQVPLVVSVVPSSEFETLTGRVVFYNPSLMGTTQNGDIVVEVSGGDRLVHLVYSPFDFGFDAPSAKITQLMPKEMISNQNLVWNFKVHPPLNEEERGPCRPLPKVMKDKDGK